ncbi:hypothetical protein [Halomarina oriensis]|uniref:Uncharacterized protein n=1 Tax=Halomarina oriensis TaxID=671145 RepID=A0A6B0GMW3_9EURY|nr:hypothetical protein [Halomarina oriensis]MWG34819.1 hypothetical protein [Halomarina oriensis]
MATTSNTDESEAQPDESPPEDAGMVSVADVTVSRDQEGNVLPEKQYVEELDGYVKARRLTKNAREQWIMPLLSGEDISDAQLADLYESHLVEPDLTNDEGEVTERLVAEELDPAMEDGLLYGILLVSDLDEIVDRLRRYPRGDISDEEMDRLKRLDELQSLGGDDEGK